MAKKTKVSHSAPDGAEGVADEYAALHAAMARPPADDPDDLVEVLVPAGAPMVSLEDGVVIEGIYVGAVDAVSAHGPGKLHYILTDDGGGLVCTWGVYAVDQTLGRIPRGTWVRLAGGPLEELDSGRSMRLVRCWTSRSRSVQMDSLPSLPSMTVRVEGEP